MAAHVASHHIAISAAAARSMAGARRPNGSSRPLTRRFNGVLNGACSARVRRSRTSAAIVSTSITAMAIAYARASQGTRPPLASITSDHGGGGDVDAHVPACRTADEGTTVRGQRAVGRRLVEQLLGIGERGVSRGKKHQHGRARPRQARQISCPCAARPGAARGRPTARRSRAPVRQPARAGRRETYRAP